MRLRSLLFHGTALCILLLTRPLAAKEQWVSVSSAQFKVLTTAKMEVARSWALELERFREMLHAVLNVPEQRLRPVTIVLFPSDRAMRPFKPLEKGKPKDVAGLFVNFCDSHAIELSLDADPEQIRRVIFHEAVHWYTNAGDDVLPMWLEEGVAEVYSTFTTAPDGTCSFGRVIKDHLALLAETPRCDMRKLVNTGADSLQYNEGDHASRFYAESWLATHYLLFGANTPGRTSVVRYLEMRSHAPTLEVAFEQAFGVNYEIFSKRLNAYREGGHYSIYSYRLPVEKIEGRLTARNATAAEVELALATLQIGARQQGTPEAEGRLQRAAALAPDNPVIWQVLGESAVLDQRPDDAERYFAKAVAAGSDSYYAHYGLAYARVKDLDAAQGLFDTSAVAESMREFRHAIGLNPRFVPAYEGLAGLMFALEGYDPTDRARLEQGARLAPGPGMIEVGLAVCDLHEGRREQGRHRLERVVQAPGAPPEARVLATRVLHGDEWNETFAQLQGLFEHDRYAEAVRLIDSVSGRFEDPRFRDSLAENRRRAVDLVHIQEAVATANDGNRPAAIKLLHAILDSDAGENAKREARRLLGQLEKSFPATDDR